MSGGQAKSSSQKLPSSSSQRKSRWEPEINPAGEQKTGAMDNRKQKSHSNRKENPSPSSVPIKNPGHLSDPVLPYAGAPFSAIPGQGQGPQPKYGFHMLDRRTIVLADGNVRTYFALPPDYRDFPHGRPLDPAARLVALSRDPDAANLGFEKRFPPDGLFNHEGINGRDDPSVRRHQHQDYWTSSGLDAWGDRSLKRKYAEDMDGIGMGLREREDYPTQSLPRHLLPIPGNLTGYSVDIGTSSPHRRDSTQREDLRPSKGMRLGGVFDTGIRHSDVDDGELNKAFLYFYKLINENASQRNLYLEDGKVGAVPCAVCGRSVKEFPDMHSLVMHTFSTDNAAESKVEHKGFYKALCVLMGWDYSKTPDNSKVYQFLSADEAEKNQNDMIVWPPLVIIHNTATGKGKDGRMEGLGNKAMDSRLRDLGFAAGKAKSVYGKDGHSGVTLVKFAGDSSGLNDAVKLSDHFQKQHRGRKAWVRLRSSSAGLDDDSNPDLVEIAGEKKRVLYGFLATVSDMDVLDGDTRKKASVESMAELGTTPGK